MSDLEFVVVIIVATIIGYFICIFLEYVYKRHQIIPARSTNPEPKNKQKQPEKVVVPWTGILPQDIMRKIASMSDPTIRLVCKTTKEGFDESMYPSHGPFTETDTSKFMVVTGLCKWLSRLDSTLTITFNKNEQLELVCQDPVTLYTFLANDLFEKEIDLRIYCIIDSANKELVDAIYSSVPCFRALTKMHWWKSGKCNINLVARNHVNYMPFVDLKMFTRQPIVMIKKMLDI